MTIKNKTKQVTLFWRKRAALVVKWRVCEKTVALVVKWRFFGEKSWLLWPSYALAKKGNSCGQTRWRSDDLANLCNEVMRILPITSQLREKLFFIYGQKGRFKLLIFFYQIWSRCATIWFSKILEMIFRKNDRFE